MPAAVAPRSASLVGTDFATILRSKSYRRSRHFAVHWRASETSRLGLVVSRKLAGSAVRRNLVKRQARALFSQWASAANSARPALDVVVRVMGDIRQLERREQFLELGGLFAAIESDMR